ncbi:MAG: type II toxin-antitoxin system prevent-host-death family antitoxin [Chloroflexi bacterium]|nr:type II toxin-antitoxin system prevent-host-death family antitoxin [Chloroflexota bacterium]
MTITLPVPQKDKYLEKISQHISSGEEVIITQNNKPVARIMPIPKKTFKRKPGSAKGKIIISPDFNDPLSDEILDTFES